MYSLIRSGKNVQKSEIDEFPSNSEVLCRRCLYASTFFEEIQLT